jgi:hypothetical protein
MKEISDSIREGRGLQLNKDRAQHCFHALWPIYNEYANRNIHSYGHFLTFREYVASMTGERPEG